eukprot:gene5547-biopygen13224
MPSSHLGVNLTSSHPSGTKSNVLGLTSGPFLRPAREHQAHVVMKPVHTRTLSTFETEDFLEVFFSTVCSDEGLLINRERGRGATATSPNFVVGTAFSFFRLDFIVGSACRAFASTLAS